MFQNMFPSINVRTAQLRNCQRVVLLDYNKETGRIQFRHFAIYATPVGISKGLKKLVGAGSHLPNLGGLADISEVLQRGAMGYGSESEAEVGIPLQPGPLRGLQEAAPSHTPFPRGTWGNAAGRASLCICRCG